MEATREHRGNHKFACWDRITFKLVRQNPATSRGCKTVRGNTVLVAAFDPTNGRARFHPSRGYDDPCASISNPITN
jgi:hypothetical protein